MTNQNLTVKERLQALVDGKELEWLDAEKWLKFSHVDSLDRHCLFKTEVQFRIVKPAWKVACNQWMLEAKRTTQLSEAFKAGWEARGKSDE